jgi:tetratricopeptide (TPR) repeat protein
VSGSASATFHPLDPVQVKRIEAVHRGFLYQHLYAAACLMLAQNAGVTSIVVEQDEDVEIILPNKRIYVQVKTRSSPLKASDIKEAIERFEALRLQHQSGERTGEFSFIIASNIQPGTQLKEKIGQRDWPQNVNLHWPDCEVDTDSALPAPWDNISVAIRECAALAKTLPYSLLAPETLVWKLAGCVMMAATGTEPRSDHSFHATELPSIFEQIVVQLQDFPAPPEIYRPQLDEPSLVTPERIRIISGYSGAGKTSWVSQASIHTTNTTVYFDTGETPGPALSSALARELAARLFGNTGKLGGILLPGATGNEIMQGIGTRLAADNETVTVVLDNAHSVPPHDICNLIKKSEHLNFILLCQPGQNVQELEALLILKADQLCGWDTDTIAQEMADRNCRGDLAACQRLLKLTAGMPLYVQNAATIVASEYDGNLRRFCDDLEADTHIVGTAQEIILRRVFDGFSPKIQHGMGVLSVSEIPLKKDEAENLLKEVLNLEQKPATAILREFRSTGSIEIFGGGHFKIHDAMRLLARAHLQVLGDDIVQSTYAAFKNILLASLRQQWEMAKLSLYLRILVATGDFKQLAKFASDELFHEMGVMPEIMKFLEQAATDETIAPEDRFLALDGLVFADLKQGKHQDASKRLDIMSHLLFKNGFGDYERLTLEMKRMNVLAYEGKVDEVLTTIETISEILPENPVHQRIFKHNAACALFTLKRYDAVIEETSELVKEYYDVLEISPEGIIGKNADKIWSLLKKESDPTDNVKHLADSLDLYAKAMNSLGQDSGLARIHAMKFYELARALDSLIRVGQDLIDEFVGRNDFIGAREVIETNLLPIVRRYKLTEKIIPVRSQYAVILAYCGDFDAANAEMARLAPYETGLDVKGQWELANQRQLIAKLQRQGPPEQWVPKTLNAPVKRTKVGRNEPCPCGSGQKYKRCHGG